MTTELQQHRYDAMMRRVGDLKGPGAKVSEVLAEVFPVVNLEDPPGELFALGGTGLGFGGSIRTPAVGEFGIIQVFNPVGSGMIVTVTSALMSVDATNGVNFGTVNAALPSAVQTQRHRDQRFGFTTLPATQIRNDSAPGISTATGQVGLLENQPLLLSDRNGLAILPEGFGFEVAPLSVNIAIRATFWWRERVAEPSELNL